jgi:hypothetical protein
MHFHRLQNGILVVHEGPVICRLLKITPKASSDVEPSPKPDANRADESSSGLALGKKNPMNIKAIFATKFSL